MDIEGFLFGITDWANVPETVHPGTSGVAHWRTVLAGNFRIRIVTCSPSYFSVHWCSRVTSFSFSKAFSSPRWKAAPFTASPLACPIGSRTTATRIGRPPKRARLFIVD